MGQHEDEQFAELRKQVDDLKSEIARRDKISKVQKSVAWWAMMKVVGSRLHGSAYKLRKEFERYQCGEREHMPIPEAVDVVATGFIRFVRVGMIGTLIACLPVVLLGVQNLIMWRQFNSEKDRQQLQRKTELISVLWDTKELEGPWYAPIQNSVRETVPIASATHRREASIEYVDLLRERGEVVSLQSARLDGVVSTSTWIENVGEYLFGSNLQGAILRHGDFNKKAIYAVDLRDADLMEANLAGAAFPASDLRKANLSLADLSGAYLIMTDLRDALLICADLEGAYLHGAQLSGADLTGARLSGAIYFQGELPALPMWNPTPLRMMSWNAATSWPDGFIPPAKSEYLDSDGNGSNHPQVGKRLDGTWGAIEYRLQLPPNSQDPLQLPRPLQQLVDPPAEPSTTSSSESSLRASQTTPPSDPPSPK